MSVAVVYVYPLDGQGDYFNSAFRFLDSYYRNPPGIDHDTIIVCNGAKRSFEAEMLFGSMPHLQFLEHDNSGYDIGAFQHAARDIPADIMVFFGVTTFFGHPGWLRRMVESCQRHGNAQYGAMGNRGDARVSVCPHIRTTAWWMSPKLLSAYPQIVSRPEQRHPFEHRKGCFTDWVTTLGLKSWVVTWTREVLWEQWDSDPNGFQQGDQSSLLAYDHICELPLPRRW